MNTDSLATVNQSSVAAAFVCPLTAAHLSKFVGGKASNLGKMIDLGMTVPPGLVITDHAFQLFLDANELRTVIEAELADLKPSQLEEINTASLVIRSRILAAKIPDEVLAPIHDMVSNRLPGATLAVRSSAIGEDSHQAAFAGQLDSFLNIDSQDGLVEAVLACWASYWSQRSIFYQLSRGIYLQGMGVVIQELVKSRIAGILFTQNPSAADGDPESLLVEYCFGYGDDLAAGKLNPGRFNISRDDFSWQVQATPEQESRIDDSCLFNEKQIERLSRAALTLENHYGCPQDIEWTINENNELYLVQTRPVTVEVVSQPLTDQPSNKTPAEALVHWSNANVNENFPEPISPFLYSIASAGYYNYFRNLGLALGFDPRRIEQMEYPLRNVIGIHGGRMYYNLTNIHAILRMAPAGELLAQWFDDFVGVNQSDDKQDSTSPQPKRSRWAWSVEWCRSAFKTTWQFLFLTKRVAAFERVVDEFAETTRPDNLAAKRLPELLNDLRGFMDIRCNRWTNASLADTAAMVTYGLLKRFLTREFPEREQSGLHHSLLKGLQDVVSGKPIVELWNLSRMVRDDAALQDLMASSDDRDILKEVRTNAQFAEFHAAFETFLEDWGFRCSGELMLTVPSFQEQPESLLEMLRAYVGVKGESPFDLLQRQSSDRIAETDRVLKQLRRRKLFWPLPWPSKATLVSWVLKRCHKSIALRERARLKQALLYSRCRRIALAIADQLIPLGFLEYRNDIFFLSIQEIESLLAGSCMFPYQTKELVRLRKEGHQRLSKMAPDDAFTLQSGAYLPINDTKQRSPNEAVDGSQTELTGVGACSGQVTATSAILTDISECRLLNEGDVLVTRQTDPGWGPVFFLIKGLVMERGGMLSHGAILAREYGIPTVVGVPNATRRISPGQKLTVNGDRGIVQLVD